MKVFAVMGLPLLVALIPYARLITFRRPITDQVQLVVELTHRPDLLRGPEIYALIILLGLFGRDWRQPKTLFMLSFAVAPFVVFNQQIITGRSVQPFHYEQFAANYWVLVGLFLAFGVRWAVSKRALILLTVVGVTLGLAYGFIAAKGRLETNVSVDQGRAAAMRLTQAGMVFAANPDISNSLAITASNPVLWARYLLTFSHAGFEEQKRRFYQHLYYSQATEQDLGSSLQAEGDIAGLEIFGVDRANPALSANPRPITAEEIERGVDEYRRFVMSFSFGDASTPELSYAIVSLGNDVSNLNKWYELDDGENVDGLIIYRLTLRKAQSQ